MPSFLDTRLDKPQALSFYANQVKKLRARHEGVTIEIAQIQVGTEKSFIASINSSATWEAAERVLLKSWGVTVVEPSFGGEMTLRDDGGALHAEENMAAYISSVGGRGLRWSRAVVAPASTPRAAPAPTSATVVGRSWSGLAGQSSHHSERSMQRSGTHAPCASQRRQQFGTQHPRALFLRTSLRTALCVPVCRPPAE